MKRYFIVNEFFGSRVYDSIEKKEKYYNTEETKLIKEKLKDQYNEIDNKLENSLSSPLKISMNLTKKCNLRCKQCFSDSGELKEEELSTEDMYKLFDDMLEVGTFFICLGGGEPFTRKDLFKILERGKKNQLAVSIVSNGLLITKEIVLELNKMDLDTLWISLDGLKENHENLRGKETYEKTLNVIKMLKENFKGKLAIRVSLNKDNIGEYLDLIKVAEDLDVDILRFTPILSFGRAKNEDLIITQDQYISFLDKIKTIKSKVNLIYPDMPNTSKFWINPNDFGCHCGKEAIWIDELGNYSPCIFFGEEFNVGNIKQDDYKELWKKSKEISKYEGNNVCKSCENYHNCRGGCRARVLDELGNWNDVDTLCPLRKNKKD